MKYIYLGGYYYIKRACDTLDPKVSPKELYKIVNDRLKGNTCFFISNGVNTETTLNWMIEVYKSFEGNSVTPVFEARHIHNLRYVPDGDINKGRLSVHVFNFL